MLKSSIHVDMRNQEGSRACNRIRNHGQIPAVVYGRNTAATKLEVNKRELDDIIRNHGANIVLALDMGNHEVTVMLKEIQREPLTKQIIHVDFQEVSHNQLIHTTVPIRLVGRMREDSKDGVIQQQLRELHIECLPGHMPSSIDLDISNLAPGQPLKVADVEFATELSILNDPEEVIAALAKAARIEEKSEEDLLERVTEVPRA